MELLIVYVVITTLPISGLLFLRYRQLVHRNRKILMAYWRLRGK